MFLATLQIVGKNSEKNQLSIILETKLTLDNTLWSRPYRKQYLSKARVSLPVKPLGHIQFKPLNQVSIWSNGYRFHPRVSFEENGSKGFSRTWG